MFIAVVALLISQLLVISIYCIENSKKIVCPRCGAFMKKRIFHKGYKCKYCFKIVKRH